MSDNVELRVNLVPSAQTALEDTATLLGFSRTDVVNRAIQLYAYVEMERHVHGADLVMRDPDGSAHSIWLSDDADELKARLERRLQPKHEPSRTPWWRRWAS